MKNIVSSLRLCVSLAALAVCLPLAAQAQYDFSKVPTTGAGGAVMNDGRSSEPTPADPRTRARIHTELGALYFQEGNPAAAIDHLSIAIQVDPDYATALSVRGLVLADLKEFAKAEADFSRALSRAPNDPEINNNYGWFLCETGKVRESVAYFERALRDPLYETPDRAHTNAGNCLLRIGELESAQRHYLQAVRLSRTGAVPARLGLADIFFRQGNADEARIYLNDALRMMEPASPAALWFGLRIERKAGNKSAESSFAAQLRGRYPTSEEYQQFLKGNFE